MTKPVIYRTGSGFFLDGEGTAVTNYHVINGGYSAKVTVPIRAKYTTSLASTLTVRKATGPSSVWTERLYLPAGRGREHRRGGATVFAIGSPLGLQSTMTQGIISNPCRAEGESISSRPARRFQREARGGADQ
jgi:S1-C subfamily serine protease